MIGWEGWFTENCADNSDVVVQINGLSQMKICHKKNLQEKEKKLFD